MENMFIKGSFCGSNFTFKINFFSLQFQFTRSWGLILIKNFLRLLSRNKAYTMSLSCEIIEEIRNKRNMTCFQHICSDPIVNFS